MDSGTLNKFNSNQVRVVNDSVATAEDLVFSHFKISPTQWQRLKYDVKTLADLYQDEIVYGPYAQVVKYRGKPKHRQLSSASYDLYKICLQDHSILSTMNDMPEIQLYPFTVYITTHELIHVVRFAKFLHNFDATIEERMAEEHRVHDNTQEILNSVNIPGLHDVLQFCETRCSPSIPFTSLS